MASQDAARTSGGPVARLLGWAGPRRWYYLASVLLAVAGVVGSIVPYFSAANMIVGVLGGVRVFSYYARWALVAAGGALAYLVFHYASTAVSHVATFATISGVRRAIADKLTRVEMGYVLDTPYGRLKNIMVEKADSIETTLAHAVPEMTSNLLVPVAVVAYMFSLDWRMALAALVTIPLGALCFMGMLRDYEAKYGEFVEANESMNATAVEYVNGIEVIKAFGQSASSYEKFTRAVHRAAHSAIDWMHSVQVFQDAGLAVMPATLVCVLPVGCVLVMQGTLEPATFVIEAVLSLAIFPPLYAAFGFVDNLSQIGTIVGAIAEVLDQPEQRRAERPAPLAAPDGSPLAPGAAPTIELSGVRFSYGEDEVVHGVDLVIEPGQVTALVGPSGSGKSTLARLVAGFWDADAGSVRFGGADVRDMTAGQLADLVAYVEQDNYLFDETVMENIRMGRPGATDEEVVACARAAGCDGFIRGLAHGYQTVVGGAGGHLSGGERQRIAIARAMLKDAPVVILDEATAYTDSESEAVVEDAVSRLVAGRTLVVIAHRLSTVTGAGKIVVVNDGRIEDEGTHEELLSRCGLYREMWRAHEGARDEG